MADHGDVHVASASGLGFPLASRFSFAPSTFRSLPGLCFALSSLVKGFRLGPLRWYP